MMIVNEDKCIGCKKCIYDCPTSTIIYNERKKAYIENERCINCGHCIAICPTAAVYSDSLDMSEVEPYNEEKFSVNPENLLNFIKFRRSTRHFQDKPLEKETIERILQAGRYTESSTNSQDVSYIVVSEELDKVSDQIYRVLKKKGEHILANLSPETEHLKKYATLWTTMYDAYLDDKAKNDRLFFHAPAVVFVTAGQEINGALASATIELMANARGVGCCYCGFALVALNDQPELLKELGVQEGKKIIACLVMGYPSVKYQRTVPRNPLSVLWK